MKEFLNFAKSLIALLLVLFLLFTFCIGVKMAPNDDMNPRISAGDILIYYRIDTMISASDVVIVEKNGTEYALRVVAKGGDTVDITDEENLVINGNMVSEGDIFYSTPRYEGFTDYPVKLASDECFVLADKREGGEDSRYFGPVKMKDVKGTVVGLIRRGGF